MSDDAVENWLTAEHLNTASRPTRDHSTTAHDWKTRLCDIYSDISSCQCYSQGCTSRLPIIDWSWVGHHFTDIHLRAISRYFCQNSIIETPIQSVNSDTMLQAATTTQDEVGQVCYSGMVFILNGVQRLVGLLSSFECLWTAFHVSHSDTRLTSFSCKIFDEIE